MKVGAVGMLMRSLVVSMRVTVAPDDRGVVRVVVMPVVVTMGVLVQGACMRVPMLVLLCGVQVEGETKEHRRAEGRQPVGALTHGPRDSGADKRRQRKDRPRAPRANPPLSE